MRIDRLSALLFFAATGLASVGCGGPPPPSKSPGPPKPKPAPAAIQGDPIVGQQKFLKTCSACHGPAGLGLPKLGKNLVTSEWSKSKNDSELLAFLKVGRPAYDPLNTTKVDMPPKGGNPSLNDKDLADIVAFVRMLQRG